MGRPTIDFTGQRFGKLRAVRKVRKPRDQWLWRFDCECGGCVVRKPSDARRTGHCGCMSGVRIAIANKRHGHSIKGPSRTYLTWQNMKARCLNPKALKFKDYGGRGITICQSWIDSFDAFLRDMGERPEGMTLGRKDNDCGYNPENCRWENWSTQTRNCRDSVMLTFNGETLQIDYWAERLGVNRRTLLTRKTKLGWSDEETLLTPVKKRKMV